MVRQRVQFSLRGLFVIAAMVALLAAGAHWFLRHGSWVLFVSLVMGLIVGLALPPIIQNVHLTPLLSALLITLVAFGLWFSGHRPGYLGGILVGLIAASQGLNVLNAVFRFGGLTVVRDSTTDDDR